MSEEETKPAPLPLMSADQLLALSNERRFVRADIPPLGAVRLRSLMANEVVELDRYMFDDKGRYVKDRELYRVPRLLIMAVCDAAGNPLFNESHLVSISKWPQALLAGLAERADALNNPSFLPAFAEPA